MERPVEKYEGGIHHLAQPTMDPGATLNFYVGVMGAKITHCISSRGWRPDHRDYIHMFLDLGKGDNIAMFYYFGVEDPADWPRYGTHHSFGASSIDELDRWEEWLRAKGHKIVWRAQYEIMTSLYVWDPNGRFLEIATQHRELNAIDAEDAELTAEALVRAAGEKAASVTQMWQHKAELVERRYGQLGRPAILFPKVDEFLPLLMAAQLATPEHRLSDRGAFTAVEAEETLRISKPADLPEAVWWGVGTGGIKGTVESFTETEFVLAG
jgi:hypothetical protein